MSDGSHSHVDLVLGPEGMGQEQLAPRIPSTVAGLEDVGTLEGRSMRAEHIATDDASTPAKDGTVSAVVLVHQICLLLQSQSMSAIRNFRPPFRDRISDAP